MVVPSEYGSKILCMLNLLFKNSENHKYFPLKTLYLYNQEVNINSFSHLGDNVSYPEQCFKLFDDSVMPSNFLIWLFHSQTKMVPNGQKFTFSPELLILLPPHHQLSRGKSLQPSYPFCLHLDRRWASWINFTFHLVLKPLPSCFPFLSPSLSLPTSIKLWASYGSVFAAAS